LYIGATKKVDTNSKTGFMWYRKCQIRASRKRLSSSITHSTSTYSMISKYQKVDEEGRKDMVPCSLGTKSIAGREREQSKIGAIIQVYSVVMTCGALF
jgi:hypothetical protein